MRRLTGYGPSIIVAVTAVFVLLAGPKAVQHLTYAQTSARVMLASEQLQGDNVLEQMNEAYRNIAIAVEPSVVHISARRTPSEPAAQPGPSGLSSGSGWIYDEHGHIVTNHHVVEDAQRIDVQLYNGEIRPAETVGYDRSTDIAVLKISSETLHPAVRRSPDIPLRQGDMVFAFGSPFDFRFSMSSGIVSGQGRSVGVIRDQFGQTGYENFIQVDAAINPGNSGGPLTDYRGHVIGMNTAIATGPRRGYDPGQFAGIGLAIPMEMIEPVVTQLINTGEVRKGFLGVSIVDRTRTIQEELAVKGFGGAGVLVARVEPDTPQVSDTLQAGDVITGINGRPIGSVEYGRPVATVDDLLDMLPEQDDEQMVQLSLWRFDGEENAGARRSVTLPLDTLRELRGLSLVDMSDFVSRRLELQGFSGRGVPVARLDPTGPALSAGLQAGDVLTHVNDRPVAQVDQVRSIVSSMLPDETVSLRVWRYDPETDSGMETSVQVTLAQLDLLRMTGALPLDQDRDGVPELGIARMRTATEALADEYGVEFHPGVIVDELVPGTMLHERVEPGSIIVRVMDRTVSDVDAFLEALSQVNLARGGARVLIIDPSGDRISEVLRVE